MIDSSSDFTRRTEQAWLISQQPSPIGCSSCNSKGNIECKWCGGTGFFILGDNMLCEVPSRNTSCKICVGKMPTEQSETDTSSSAIHCLPDIRIANEANATATAERAFFHASKALTTVLHPLQCITCRKYLLAKFGACIVPMPPPPLAGEEADSPATIPAGACSTTAGSLGNEIVL
ncbi:hypothetical protein TanjilG_30685 [Lupinus angustifolius]|uniref:Uncharacterized protein n=1 Tax=Lupinus angustifolius TaxID=3871 RepID=A0A4P1RNP2_LUPAN|nr:hypothetical protein TanjilG_30685 [Lupinus angustifolius]